MRTPVAGNGPPNLPSAFCEDIYFEANMIEDVTQLTTGTESFIMTVANVI